MKNLFLILIVFSLTLHSFCQTKKLKLSNVDISYSNPKDSNSNYYIAFKPEGQCKGLLLLLTSFGEPPENAIYETTIQTVAAKKGILTVFASLQAGAQTFFVDSVSQTSIDNLIIDLQKKYNLIDKPFYLGGFSLGGAGVVKYAERAYSSAKLVKPKSIFAIDPPLDFERWYLSLEYEARNSTVEMAKREAGYFIQRLQKEFQSTPHKDNKPFQIISPYSFSDTLQTNISTLLNCPILLISEPEIIWQMEERNRSLYDLHTLDCSLVINALRNLGNKNAKLVLTTNKGYRKLTGNKNPHSWSIADPDKTIKWMLGEGT